MEGTRSSPPQHSPPACTVPSCHPALSAHLLGKEGRLGRGSSWCWSGAGLLPPTAGHRAPLCQGALDALARQVSGSTPWGRRWSSPCPRPSVQGQWQPPARFSRWAQPWPAGGCLATGPILQGHSKCGTQAQTRPVRIRSPSRRSSAGWRRAVGRWGAGPGQRSPEAREVGAG